MSQSNFRKTKEEKVLKGTSTQLLGGLHVSPIAMLKKDNIGFSLYRVALYSRRAGANSCTVCVFMQALFSFTVSQHQCCTETCSIKLMLEKKLKCFCYSKHVNLQLYCDIKVAVHRFHFLYGLLHLMILLIDDSLFCFLVPFTFHCKSSLNKKSLEWVKSY